MTSMPADSSAAAFSDGSPPRMTAANAALKGAATLWFAVAVIGQWTFFYYIAAFYGPSSLSGNFQAWSRNTFLIKGYVAGDTAGNLAFAAHALLAAVIAFGGALQLIPQIRTYAPTFHRWNGRVFLVTALALSVTGLYMVWVRGDSIDMLSAFATSLNAALIFVCAGFAWRTALQRDFPAHRRWAFRTYLVANGQWFIRVGVFAWIVVTQGHAKIGPFFRFWEFGCCLVPLAVLELYLRAKNKAGPRGRFAVAGGLAVLTVLMGVGIFGVTMFVWRPLLAKL
jgi:hypothetical protein